MVLPQSLDHEYGAQRFGTVLTHSSYIGVDGRVRFGNLLDRTNSLQPKNFSY